MSHFIKQTVTKKIIKVVAHEIGHLITSILLNEINNDHSAESIKIILKNEVNKVGGQIEYLGVKSPVDWIFPDDLNACYYKLFSLYSGCIWESFSSLVLENKSLDTDIVLNCYKESGAIDYTVIFRINHSHLKKNITKENEVEKIIKPYIYLLNNLDKKSISIIFDYLNKIAVKIENHFSNGDLEYIINEYELRELKAFIYKEFIKINKKELLNIIDNIEEIIK